MRWVLKLDTFAKKILSDVDSNKEFKLHYGGRDRHLKNIVDLRLELESMSLDEFSHHVSTQKNDFANWVLHAIGDTSLSKDLFKTTDKDKTISLVKKRIDFAVKVLEKENKKLLSKELKTIHKLEKQFKDKPSIEHELEVLEKGLKDISSNISIEERMLEQYDDDLVIKPWTEYQDIPIHARIVEFIFGLVIGLVAGMFLARIIFG